MMSSRARTTVVQYGGQMAKLITIAVCLFCLHAAPAAAAPTGVITRAEASPDWVTTTVAGSISRSDCVATCEWLALLWVQPSMPNTPCITDVEDVFDSGSLIIWGTERIRGNAAATFDVSLPVFPGVQSQRACLAYFDYAVPNVPGGWTYGVAASADIALAPPAILPPAPSPPAVAPPVRRPCAGKSGGARAKCLALARCTRIRSKVRRVRCKRTVQRKYR